MQINTINNAVFSPHAHFSLLAALVARATFKDVCRFSAAFLLSCCCAAQTPATPASELEAVILDTQINHQTYGQHFFFLDADYRVYVRPETLSALGIKSAIWQAWANQEWFALAVLEPAIKYQFDEINIRLLLQADPSVFEPQVIRVQPAPIIAERHLITAEPLSAFVNYAINASETKPGWDLEMSYEIGLKYNNLFFDNHFICENKNPTCRRLLSNLTWDRPDKLQRWVFGDFSPLLQALDETALVTGISLRRFFAQQPDFSSLPTLQLHQWLTHPTTLEMYLNEELLDTWSVKPGEVVLTDFMQGAGHGRVQLKMKDIFGQARFYQQAFLLDHSLLKPGLQDYSYQFGWQRGDFAKRNLAFGDWWLSGQHRYGIANHLTAGLAFAAKPQAGYVSPSLTWVWKGRVQSQWAAHYKQHNGHSDWGASAFAQYQARHFNLSVGADAYSALYAADSPNAPLQQRVFGGVSLPNRGNWGSVSLFLEHSQYWQAATQQSYSLNYQNKLLDNWHLLLNVRYQTGEESDLALFGGLHYRFGKDWRVNLRQSHSGGLQRRNISMSKSASRGLGHGYRMDLQQAGKSDWQANARWLSRWHYGVLDSHYLQRGDRSQARVSWAGSLAWLPDAGVYFSRPISDSFAVVSTHQANVPIQISEQLMGYSNADGELLLPELGAFYENRVKIDLNSLPMNYSLEQAEQFVKPSYRSGARLHFVIEKFSAVEGKLLHQQQPLEQMPLQLQLKDKILRAVIGKDGYFYIENLPTGKYSGRVSDKKIHCRFSLDVPESDAVVQYLGEIACE